MQHTIRFIFLIFLCALRPAAAEAMPLGNGNEPAGCTFPSYHLLQPNGGGADIGTLNAANAGILTFLQASFGYLVCLGKEFSRIAVALSEKITYWIDAGKEALRQRAAAKNAPPQPHNTSP
jgi:hypothetical protein